MSYRLSLEANGVTVKVFEEFGSYQGTWIAILEDGRFVEGSYGSCSGCDAFQAEFGWEESMVIKQENGKYYEGNRNWDEDSIVSEERANELNKQYEEKLRQFGECYLKSSETKEEIVARYKRKCDDEYCWGDDKEILEWIEKH